MHSIFTVNFPDNATMKQAFALWVNLTQHEEQLTLLPGSALEKKTHYPLYSFKMAKPQ
jgi:hypothetical protein